MQIGAGNNLVKGLSGMSKLHYLSRLFVRVTPCKTPCNTVKQKISASPVNAVCNLYHNR